MFIVVHFCLCHSDSASALPYFIVSSLLTFVRIPLLCKAPSSVTFCIREGNDYILRRAFVYKLAILQAFTAAQDMLIPQVPLVEPLVSLGVNVGPSWYTVVCATVMVHQFFYIYLYAHLCT